jgi:hypothetical protein
MSNESDSCKHSSPRFGAVCPLPGGQTGPKKENTMTKTEIQTAIDAGDLIPHAALRALTSAELLQLGGQCASRVRWELEQTCRRLLVAAGLIVTASRRDGYDCVVESDEWLHSCRRIEHDGRIFGVSTSWQRWLSATGHEHRRCDVIVSLLPD